MPTTTIRKWIWGSEGSDKRVCGPTVVLDETAWLIIPKGSYIQSAKVWTRGKSDNFGRVRIKMNAEQLIDVLNPWDKIGWDETIDVLGFIHPPPPEWGEGRNEFHADFRFDSTVLKTCFDFRLYVEAVVYSPEPEEGEPPPEEKEQPHWEEKDKEKDKAKYLSLCTLAFLFGSTSLSHVFPILRMFRDQVLPQIIVEGYYRLGYILFHRLV